MLGQNLPAQNLQVQVRDTQGELPYAVVSINHRQHYLCDSLGVALLPLDKLKAGDTISSSYIGKLPAFTLYGPQTGQTCTLTHEANEVYELESVVVNAKQQSGWKAFRKYVKPDPFVFISCRLDGKFQAEITLPGHQPKQTTGTFSIENHITKGMNQQPGAFMRNFFKAPPSIQTADDTTGIHSELLLGISSTLSLSNQAIGRIFGESIRRSANSSMHYLGTKDNQHVFRFVYADKKTSFQILFRANIQTKQIESWTYNRIYVADEQFNQWDMSFTSMPCKSEERKLKLYPTMSVTQEVHSLQRSKNGLIRELTLSEIQCELRRNE